MKDKKTKKLGLIISNRNISIVEVENGKNGPVVTNYSKILLEEGIVESDCIVVNQEAFEEAIEKLMKTGVGGPISGKEILVSIPEEKIFSHQVVIPIDKANDLSVIKETAKDFIPIELDEAVFDYKIAEENPEEKTVTLNVVAVQDSIVEPLVTSLKKMKLTVTGIDYDINCIVRAFNNKLNNYEGDFLIIHSDSSKNLVVVNSKNDNIYKLTRKNNTEELIESIKALIGAESTEKVRELIIKNKKEPSFTPEQEEEIKKALKPQFEELSTKIRQLITIAESKEEVDIKMIYLTGSTSGLPGVMETLKSKCPPETEIRQGVQFTEVPDEIEDETLEGIGLCLKDSPGLEKNNFNLLPSNKKEELTIAKITPKLQAISIGLTIFMVGLVVTLGVNSSKKYLEYHTTAKEASILNEKTLNPYITQTASVKESRKRLDNQLLSIIDDTIPVSFVMEYMDLINAGGVRLKNLTFDDRESGATASINLKAEVVDRETTEKLANSLEKSALTTEVISPLSNLIGKGERLVTMNLTIDKAVVTASANREEEDKKENTETNEDTKKPSLPVNPETNE